MTCEFTPEETELIAELLELHQATLLRDIARADHRDYKEMLRTRLKLLEGLQGKVKVTQVA